MQILLLLLSCTACALGYRISPEVKTHFSYYDEWDVFKKIYAKRYGNIDTELERFEIFKASLKYIEEHNRLYVMGEKSYFLGINKFSDMNREEFRSLMGLDKVVESKPWGVLTFQPNSRVQVPDVVDWRKEGYVTPVKDQGTTCGSCWAFSATGAMEGQYFKTSGNLIPFSEQQLIDCSDSFGNQGCKGGYPSNAFNYIILNGIQSSNSYPYEGRQSTCRRNASMIVTNCTSYVNVISGSEDSLQTSVATIGPISCGMDANHTSFQYYKGGLYNEPSCSSTVLNHAVLAIGYGTTGGDYWLIKNSWGTSWGDQGYAMMSRNKNNQCGIATLSNYPQI